MAGDWIKMRGALIDHPKVIALGRLLHENKEFREWLTPGGGGVMNGQIVSDHALRCVTTALLLKVWSVAREHGKFVKNDLVLECSELSDIDQIAGVYGFGDALNVIGWALPKHGVTLPNFLEYNVPMTGAERQNEYRKRAMQRNADNVTPTSPHSDALTVTKALPEKRREVLNIGTVLVKPTVARANKPKVEKTKSKPIEIGLTVKPLPAQATIRDTPTPQQIAMRQSEQQRQSMAARAAAKAHPGKPLEPHSNRPSAPAIGRTVLTVPQPKAAATQGAARLEMMLSAEKGKR